MKTICIGQCFSVALIDSFKRSKRWSIPSCHSVGRIRSFETELSATVAEFWRWKLLWGKWNGKISLLDGSVSHFSEISPGPRSASVAQEFSNSNGRRWVELLHRLSSVEESANENMQRVYTYSFSVFIMKASVGGGLGTRVAVEALLRSTEYAPSTPSSCICCRNCGGSGAVEDAFVRSDDVKWGGGGGGAVGGSHRNDRSVRRREKTKTRVDRKCLHFGFHPPHVDGFHRQLSSLPAFPLNWN